MREDDAFPAEGVAPARATRRGGLRARDVFRSGVNGTPTFLVNGDRYDGP